MECDVQSPRQFYRLFLRDRRTSTVNRLNDTTICTISWVIIDPPFRFRWKARSHVPGFSSLEASNEETRSSNVHGTDTLHVSAEAEGNCRVLPDRSAADTHV